MHKSTSKEDIYVVLKFTIDRTSLIQKSTKCDTTDAFFFFLTADLVQRFC